MRTFVRTTLLAAGALAALVPATAQAQFRDISPAQHTSLQLQVDKPFFEEMSGYGFDTYVTLATFQVPVGENASLFAQAALSHADQTDLDPATDWGNPTVGLRVAPSESTNLELGLTLPWGSDIYSDMDELHEYALTTAQVADREAALDLFVTDGLSAHITGAFAHRTDFGGEVGGRLGGLLCIPTAGGTSEVYSRWGVWGEVPAGPLSVGGEVSGAVHVSEKGLSLPERTLNYFTFMVGYDGVPYQPMAFLRLPLDDDASRNLKATVGLRLSL